MREILVRELFGPLLASDIGVGTGKLVDSKNNLSQQTDCLHSLVAPNVFILTVSADQQTLVARTVRPGPEGRPTNHLGIPPHHRVSNCCSKNQ
jgi:hypothetical protein